MSSLFYFLILISVLVVIHEFGHFIAARISRMRVDIFSFGMGYRLLGWNRKTGFSFGSLSKEWESDGFTDYRISLLPIGGYVKIAGMVDESFDTEFEKSEPQPHEFRSKNAFLKAFVISAGVLMNVFLAIGIFAGIKYFDGEALRNDTVVGYVENNSVAQKSGFKIGDKILSVNGNEVTKWEEVLDLITLNSLGSTKTVTIERDNKREDLIIDGSRIIKALTGEKIIGISPRNTFVFLNNVITYSPAGKAGLLPLDTILSVNGEKIYTRYQLKDWIVTHLELPLVVEYKRGDELVKTEVSPSDNGIVGIEIAEGYSGDIFNKKYNIIEALNAGIDDSWRTIELSVLSFKHILNGNIAVKQAVAGPVMIAKKASQQADMGIMYFLQFLSLLSISLAIINILPFPALDGGHLVFIIVEAIIRREIPVKIKMVFQQVGFAVLMLLMAFVVYNDIVR